MSALLVAQVGRDLEGQICEAFDGSPTLGTLFVWLPKARKLFQAFRFPRVAIQGDEMAVEDGYEVELFRIDYSPSTMRWFLLGVGISGASR